MRARLPGKTGAPDGREQVLMRLSGSPIFRRVAWCAAPQQHKATRYLHFTYT
ncbi:hypothetical protein HMPREF9371_2043 [Neisseria shayeganii 871]|uniref:Uncharacterized protein n=1 Tax=Neisseria shayeganii 871 TaxID=1032488 RepID=G4CKA3_9NEIS|nr:hypothetical protein HMPREF9371_2043 [Neisseria shayeganii 871]